MNTNSSSLPSPRENQAFVKVSALEAGQVSVRSKLIVKGAPADEWSLCPSLSFLLEHSKTKQRFLLDLGIRKNIKTLPPSIQDEIAENFPVRVHQSVDESLDRGGMSPADVELIFLSHLHFDQ
jgi:glyoxylase-like metal-dependent hydrolase (beta-lactamase superfamily II)